MRSKSVGQGPVGNISGKTAGKNEAEEAEGCSVTAQEIQKGPNGDNTT